MASDPALSCLVFAREVCIAWDAGFPFWEVALSVITTGLVTFFTIWFSVSQSRKETARLLADAETERRAREEQERYERERTELAERTKMAESMIRAAHHLAMTRAKKPSSSSRVAARAMWASVDVQFEASLHHQAQTLFEYVDMLLRLRVGTWRKSTAEPHYRIAQRIEAMKTIDRAIANWAWAPGFSDEALFEIDALRAELSAWRARQVERVVPGKPRRYPDGDDLA